MTLCELATRAMVSRNAVRYTMDIGGEALRSHRSQIMAAPLLSIGTFGTHLISTNGLFSFTGTVPADIKRGGYSSEQEGIAAFVSWFKSQDLAFQRNHVADLRCDVFALVLTA